jgi:hypothetical protein
LQALYPKLHKQGVEYISVNEGDDAKTIKGYIKEGKFTFPIVMNKMGGPDVVGLFKVPAFPTNYIINSKGVIVAVFVGFDEDGMKKAYAKLGIKA